MGKSSRWQQRRCRLSAFKDGVTGPDQEGSDVECAIFADGYRINRHLCAYQDDYYWSMRTDTEFTELILQYPSHQLSP
jgi:hypothetical protein